MKKTIEELLQTPYWIIDILPKQVPKDGPGQYFAIADFFLQDENLTAVKQRHLNLILKLNCYRDISLDEDEERKRRARGQREQERTACQNIVKCVKPVGFPCTAYL